MAYDYTAWPTTTELTARLSQMGVTLPAAFDSSSQQSAIDAITTIVTSVTKRTFVAFAGVKYFDGTGTGEIEIDEYISFTDVQLVGYLSAPALSMANVYGPAEEQKPNTRLMIFQGSLPALGRIWLDSFPRGRRNIKVTGTWGYGATIPVDLWEAVLDAAADRLARRKTYSTAGLLGSIRDDDVTLQYGGTAGMGEAAITALSPYGELMAALKKYKRPMGVRMRARSRDMI